MAAGNKVFPCRRPSARARDYVVESEVARCKQHATVLAGIAIAQKNVLARQSSRLVRNAAVLQQPYDRRHTHGKARGVQKVAVFLFRHGQSLQHQHDRPTRSTDIDGLIGRVQDQHRSLHDHAFPWLRWFLGWLAVVAFISFVPFMHGPVFLPLARRPPSPAHSLLPSWPALPWPQKPLWLLTDATPGRTRPLWYRWSSHHPQSECCGPSPFPASIRQMHHARSPCADGASALSAMQFRVSEPGLMYPIGCCWSSESP